MIRSIYLDYAATAAIRPPEVIEAVGAYLRDVGATPGRSGHTRALDAGRIALRCRRALAELLGIEGDPGRLVFQLNATHALNTALFGLLRRGDRLVRTAYDHNGVRRPAAALAADRGVEVMVLPGDPGGGIDLARAEEMLRGNGHPARLLALPHVSNVLGQRLPVRELTELAHAQGTLVLLDAAQSVGHLPVDVRELGIDLLAFSGHKGLLGPQGVGVLWVKEGVDLAPLLYGGTGGDSLPETMPESYPDHLEAGTLNAPGIAGLLAGVRFIRERGIDRMHGHEIALKRRLYEGLAGVPGVRIHSPADPGGAGIVTITSTEMPVEELVGRLEGEHAIQCRAGLHCAPEAHQLIGTLGTGAVRLSLGWASTEEEVDRAIAAVAAIHGAFTRMSKHA